MHIMLKLTQSKDQVNHCQKARLIIIYLVIIV